MTTASTAPRRRDMSIGVVLPTTVPDNSVETVLQWARRAEELEFSSIAALDRLVYDSPDILMVLAAAAAATSRIRVATTVLLAAYRGNEQVIVKQLATLAALATDRLTLAFGVGAREDDYAVAGTDFHRRGRALDGLLTALLAHFDAESASGRGSTTRPRLLIGGHSDPAAARSARFADGWISGGASGSALSDRADRVRHHWAQAGRSSSPSINALVYVCLDRPEAARRYVHSYYGSSGAHVEKIIEQMVTDESTLRDHLESLRDVGCDEVFLCPCTDDLDELERIRAATRH